MWAIGGVFAGGLVIGGYGAHAFYAPRLELAEIRADGLAESLSVQNTAVAKLQSDGAERARRAAQALATAEQARRDAEQAAMDILTTALPAGADRCTAASQLIRKELAK